MKPIKQFFRLVYINHILAKNGLDNVIVSLRLFTPLRFIVYFNPWNWFRKRALTPGEALRKTLEELGPIFIKFGQALSTRPDILPPEIALELSKLQDKVPPFSNTTAMAILAQTYGEALNDMFSHIESTPLASASMAQVHAAKLQTGEEVVIKILRPNMRRIIEQDLSILHSIAGLADRYWAESKRLKPKEIVREFEYSLLCELDLMREAANAAQLRRNFDKSPLLYIPTIYWDYTHENILVMERIYGIPVSDIRLLNDNKINIRKLAERGVEIFFTQVFRDCFFHADMHPGNIFVSYKNPENPQYICIDFGIVGTLNDRDKRYLAENLFAFFNRDYKRVAELHVESGWVAANTRIDEFESDIRTVCEPIFERPLKDISFALIVLRLFQVARRYQMVVQPQLVLLQKTLFAVEGLGRQLYPELDLWATAKPYLEKWMKEQIGPRAFLHRLNQNLPFFMEQLPHMPKLMFDVLALKKEQMELIKDIKKPPKQGHHGKPIALGVILSFVILGFIHYFQLMNDNEFTALTFIGTVLAGFLLMIYRKEE